MILSDIILQSLSQPIGLVKKSDKAFIFGNSAMYDVVNNKLIGSHFDSYFHFMEDEFDSFLTANFDQTKSYILRFKDNTLIKYYYAHFSHMDDETIILLLTPCLLKKEIIENSFLRNHEYVVDLIENAPICIHACDPSSGGKLLWANALESKILGVPESKLVGKCITEVGLSSLICYLYFTIYLHIYIQYIYSLWHMIHLWIFSKRILKLCKK